MCVYHTAIVVLGTMYARPAVGNGPAESAADRFSFRHRATPKVASSQPTADGSVVVARHSDALAIRAKSVWTKFCFAVVIVA